MEHGGLPGLITHELYGRALSPLCSALLAWFSPEAEVAANHLRDCLSRAGWGTLPGVGHGQHGPCARAGSPQVERFASSPSPSPSALSALWAGGAAAAVKFDVRGDVNIWWRPADGVVCSIPPCQSRAATTKDIIFPLHLNKDAIVIVSVRASRVTRLERAGPINHCPITNGGKTTRNSQNAGAGVVGLAHACPALSFCHRITQRVLQPQHGALWLCIVPAASSRTAASFSSRSARRDETWSSVELIVS